MLRTERLILDSWEFEDWEAFRPIATDPEVLRYINGGIPWTDEAIQMWVAMQIKSFDKYAFCRWKIIEPSSGNLIGFCGPGMWRDYPVPEIGWWLARDQWGKGLATEAARAALSDAFERVRLDRIVSIAMPENAASIGVMKKLGLAFDTEFEHEGLKLVRYAMDRGDS